MSLVTANIGSYPRVGETRDQQRLRRAYAQRERNELSPIGFQDVERSVTEEVIQEQIQAGIDQVTDGLVSWYDPVSHFAGRLTGVSIKGLLRFFDTNFYFRQPHVKSKLSWKKPVTAEAYTSASSVSSKPVRAVLTGPYTLAKLSFTEAPAYRRFPRLVEDYAACLSKEIQALVRAGAQWIQLDEPALLRNPSDAALAREAIESLAAHKGPAHLSLVTYFGDATPLYKKLQSFPVDSLGLDFTYGGPRLVERVASQGSAKSLLLGLVDARNTRLEDEGELSRTVGKLLDKLQGPTFLTPSAGLEYLPRDKAFAKLSLLARVRSSFAGAGGAGLRLAGAAA